MSLRQFFYDLPSSTFFDREPSAMSIDVSRMSPLVVYYQFATCQAVDAFSKNPQKIVIVESRPLSGWSSLGLFRAIQKGMIERPSKFGVSFNFVGLRVSSAARMLWGSGGTRSHCLIRKEPRHHQQSHRVLALLHQSARDPGPHCTYPRFPRASR